jgi:hypothetical protein
MGERASPPKPIGWKGNLYPLTKQGNPRRGEHFRPNQRAGRRISTLSQNRDLHRRGEHLHPN